MTDNKFRISSPFTLQQIEEVYSNHVLCQEFYNIDYAQEWLKNDDPYIDMAEFIKNVLNPKTVLDIGCGIGKLIGELRKRRINAYGVEFSDDFINASPMKKYIRKDNILDLKQFKSGEFDLIICMEVLEHLPPTYLINAINNLKRICNNKLLITIPSYGPNKFGYSGLPLNEKCWLDAARKNIPFPNLVVDENNIPHLGHISLASYRWWSLKFLQNGLIRDISCENQGYFNNNFLKYHWNTYILNKLDVDNINIQNYNFFFEGVYDLENWGQGRNIRWTHKKFDLYLKFTKPTHEIEIEFYSGLKEITYVRYLKIECKRLYETIDLHLGYQELNSNIYTLQPDTWCKFSIPINLVNVESGTILKFECELCTAFIPEYLVKNGDNRALGIALKSFGRVS